MRSAHLAAAILATTAPAGAWGPGDIRRITARVETTGKTGVEMEALTAVSVAALTVYDMIKALQRDARITNVRLVEKHGGKSGDVVLEVGG